MFMKLTLVVLLTLSSNVLFAEDDFKKAVTVSGACQKMVEPDRMSVMMVVEHLEKTSKEAIEKTHKLYAKLQDKVKCLKLKDLELNTAQYQVREERQWENNKNVFKGFKAEMGMDVSTSELKRMGEVLQVASDLGVTSIHNMRAYLSNSKKKEMELNCLEVAAQDAKAKAKKLAETLGAKLGKVLDIRQGVGQFPPHQPVPFFQAKSMGMSTMRAEVDSAPQVDVKQQEYALDIQASFALEN
jgi:uncharacterized protein YggE